MVKKETENMGNKKTQPAGISCLSSNPDHRQTGDRPAAARLKRLSVVTCSCGGKIAWDIGEKSGFCPYCGTFLSIIE